MSTVCTSNLKLDSILHSCRFQLVTGRVWRGTAFGGVKGRTEIPGLVKDYLEGKVKIDEYVTHHRTLADINEGFHDMHVSVFSYEGTLMRC